MIETHWPVSKDTAGESLRRTSHLFLSPHKLFGECLTAERVLGQIGKVVRETIALERLCSQVFVSAYHFKKRSGCWQQAFWNLLRAGNKQEESHPKREPPPREAPPSEPPNPKPGATRLPASTTARQHDSAPMSQCPAPPTARRCATEIRSPRCRAGRGDPWMHTTSACPWMHTTHHRLE